MTTAPAALKKSAGSEHKEEILELSGANRSVCKNNTPKESVEPILNEKDQYLKCLHEMNVIVEPDLFWLDGNAENAFQKSTCVRNYSTFPVIFRVKCTKRRLFRAHPAIAIIEPKQTIWLKFTKLIGETKSVLFTLEFLPHRPESIYVNTMTQQYQQSLFSSNLHHSFALGMKPHVLRIHFRSPPIEDQTLGTISREQNFKIGQRLAELCFQSKLFPTVKTNLTFSEFSLLAEATGHTADQPKPSKAK